MEVGSWWSGGVWKEDLQVNDSEDEACIHDHEETDGSHEELEGADEVFVRELVETEISLFVLGVEGPVLELVPQRLSLGDQDDFSVTLLDHEDVD